MSSVQWRRNDPFGFVIDGKHTVVSCHLKYHAEKNFLVTTGGTESTPVSDLTDEETDTPNNNIDSV